jgi:hypothetical protein
MTPEKIQNLTGSLARICRYAQNIEVNLTRFRAAFGLEGCACPGLNLEEGQMDDFIRMWDCSDASIQDFLRRFGADAKVDWTTEAMYDAIAQKVHSSLPNLQILTETTLSILRYAHPRHAGPMHDYFLPVRRLLQHLESCPECTGQLSVLHAVALAGNASRTCKGGHTFQLALALTGSHVGTASLCVFIRANPDVGSSMGVTSCGQVLRRPCKRGGPPDIGPGAELGGRDKRAHQQGEHMGQVT